MPGKHRALGTTDLPGQADKQYDFFASVGRAKHRAPGEADTALTRWVHVWDNGPCDSPPTGAGLLPVRCGHGHHAVEVYR